MPCWRAIRSWCRASAGASTWSTWRSPVEFTRPDAPPDLRKWARLKAHAEALGLPFDSPVETWLGSRPTLPDYLPAIGRSARDPPTLYAFGHQHLGLTLGPITGELVASLARDDKAALDIAPFSVERFR